MKASADGFDLLAATNRPVLLITSCIASGANRDRGVRRLQIGSVI